MVDRAEPAHIAVDFHVVRRVGKGRRGVFLAHQRREGQSIEGAAAQQPMVAKEPEIAQLADRRPGRDFRCGIGRVVTLLGHVIERGDPQVDLGRHEAGDLEAEIEPAEREVLELLGQQPIVPGGDLGQPVVRDHEGTDLRRGQVIEAQGRHLGHAELTAGH